jgi:hypothetical protein
MNEEQNRKRREKIYSTEMMKNYKKEGSPMK